MGTGFLVGNLKNATQDMKLAGSSHILELQDHIGHVVDALGDHGLRSHIPLVVDREVNNFIAQ